MDKVIKKCSECGTLNDHPIFCSNCGASLMYVDGRPLEAAPTTPGGNASILAGAVKSALTQSSSSAQLECLSQPEFIFQLRDGSIVGRRGDVDVTPLEKSTYISREHARFLYREGSWLLEHLSQRNSTYVNGIKVLPGNFQKVYDGDKITLANTSFLFREGKK